MCRHPGGVSASHGFEISVFPGRSMPQVLEQELGTSNGSPPLRMRAAPLRRQSIGLLWFITDKSGVVTFYLLI